MGRFAKWTGTCFEVIEGPQPRRAGEILGRVPFVRPEDSKAERKVPDRARFGIARPSRGQERGDDVVEREGIQVDGLDRLGEAVETEHALHALGDEAVVGGIATRGRSHSTATALRGARQTTRGI